MGDDNTLYSGQNANGLLFFEMMFVAMRAMLSALFTFPPNFKIMLKVGLIDALLPLCHYMFSCTGWLAMAVLLVLLSLL